MRDRANRLARMVGDSAGEPGALEPDDELLRLLSMMLGAKETRAERSLRNKTRWANRDRRAWGGEDRRGWPKHPGCKGYRGRGRR
jgi:hypothetical protein